jgi:hypothetical protein
MASRFQRLRGLPSSAEAAASVQKVQTAHLEPNGLAAAQEVSVLDLLLRAAGAGGTAAAPAMLHAAASSGPPDVVGAHTGIAHAQRWGTAYSLSSGCSSGELDAVAGHANAGATARLAHGQTLSALLQALPKVAAADAAMVAQGVADMAQRCPSSRFSSARAGGLATNCAYEGAASSAGGVTECDRRARGEGGVTPVSGCGCAGASIDSLLVRLSGLKASRQLPSDESLGEEAEVEAARLRGVLMAASGVGALPPAASALPTAEKETEAAGSEVARTDRAGVSDAEAAVSHAAGPSVGALSARGAVETGLKGLFPGHVAALFTSDSWELRAMAVERMAAALADAMRGDDGEGGYARAGCSRLNVSPCSSVASSPDSCDAPPRFWAKATPVRQHAHGKRTVRAPVRAPLVEERDEAGGDGWAGGGEGGGGSQAGGAGEVEVGKAEWEQGEEDCGEKTCAESGAVGSDAPPSMLPSVPTPHGSAELAAMLQAACWMLRDALADTEPRVASVALQTLPPQGAVLSQLMGRCLQVEVRRGIRLSAHASA